MRPDLVSEDVETRLRAVAAGLRIKGHKGMTLEQIEAALVDYTAMRMREDAIGRLEDSLNSPSRMPRNV